MPSSSSTTFFLSLTFSSLRQTQETQQAAGRLASSSWAFLLMIPRSRRNGAFFTPLSHVPFLATYLATHRDDRLSDRPKFVVASFPRCSLPFLLVLPSPFPS
mmetsp:Transcript_21375/g.65950  ORF Transcript_21375/g.65950 Transcript_21375/m.65950 type:complete len:102 (-) Transcript_21375:94-399(-)